MNKLLIIMPFYLDYRCPTDYQFQTALSLSNKEYKVIAVLLYKYRDLWNFLKTKFVRRPPQLLVRKSRNIYHFTPLKIEKFFQTNEFTKWIQDLFTVLQLCFISRKYKNHTVVLWCFEPSMYRFAKLAPKSWYVLYDCVDYHVTIDKTETKKIQKQEKILIKTADLTITNTQHLRQILQKKYKQSEILSTQASGLKNYWVSPKYLKKNNPSLKLPYPRPIIGYWGTVSYRLDFSLIYKLVKNCPDWSFVFKGRILKHKLHDDILKTDSYISKLKQLPNVYFDQSQVSYQDLPYILKQFDIGLVPYQVSQKFNKYSFPLKIHEYAALKVPVISTPIEAVKTYKGIIQTKEDHRQFANSIETILKERMSENLLIEGREIAISHTWKNRVEEIISLLNKKAG